MDMTTSFYGFNYPDDRGSGVAGGGLGGGVIGGPGGGVTGGPGGAVAYRSDEEEEVDEEEGLYSQPTTEKGGLYTKPARVEGGLYTKPAREEGSLYSKPTRHITSNQFSSFSSSGSDYSSQLYTHRKGH